MKSDNSLLGKLLDNKDKDILVKINDFYLPIENIVIEGSYIVLQVDKKFEYLLDK